MNLATRLVALSARLLLALGIVCLLLGGWLGWQTMSFAWSASPATGRVVSHLEVRDDGKTQYRPRIRFETYDGAIYTFTGQLGSTSKRFAVGDEVPVMYQGKDPAQARVAQFTDNWLG